MPRWLIIISRQKLVYEINQEPPPSPSLNRTKETMNEYVLIKNIFIWLNKLDIQVKRERERERTNFDGPFDE